MSAADPTPEPSADPAEAQLWTLDQVQAYLGHRLRRSSIVWLSRHRVRGQHLYPADTIRTLRYPKDKGFDHDRT